MPLCRLSLFISVEQEGLAHIVLGLILALYKKINPGHVQEIICVAMDQTELGHVQIMSFNLCTIIPAP